MFHSNNKGFTLIELIIVLALIALFVMLFVVELGLAFLVASKLLVPLIGLTGGGAFAATVVLTLIVCYAGNGLVALMLTRSGIKERIDAFYHSKSADTK